MGVGVIRWIENTVTEPSYFKLSTDSCPTHLAILDEVASIHTSLHPQILCLLIRLFESKQDELEILVQLEMKKMLLDRMVNLLVRGCVVPVVKYIKQCWGRGDTDISLIRYFVTEVLETITHPYSSEFVSLFLPMVENEEITGTMRGDGDNDPVSEFIGKDKSLLFFNVNLSHLFNFSSLQGSLYDDLNTILPNEIQALSLCKGDTFSMAFWPYLHWLCHLKYRLLQIDILFHFILGTKKKRRTKILIKILD